MYSEYTCVYKNSVNKFTNIIYESHNATKTKNDISVLELTTIANLYPVGTFERDGIIYLSRSLGGSTELFGETIWFVRKIIRNTSMDGNETLTLVAFDPIDLLKRHIVAYLQGTDYTDKIGVVDDLMKDIVNENMGAFVFDLDRDLRPLLTVQENKSEGIILQAEIAWQNVLDVIQDMADASESYGVRILFDIVYVGENSLEFRTYKDFRGVDRGRKSLRPLLLSTDLGNLGSASLEKNYEEEINYAYALGKAEGLVRPYSEFREANSYAKSAYNRCELAVDGNNAESRYQLRDIAYDALYANRGKLIITGNLLETPITKFNVDFNYGSKVAMQYNEFVQDSYVDVVTSNFSQSNGEVLDIKVYSEFGEAAKIEYLSNYGWRKNV